MRVSESRSRITAWHVAVVLSLVLVGWEGTVFATGNQDESSTIGQNTGEGWRKTSVVQLNKK
jgi:hypothetical protein